MKKLLLLLLCVLPLWGQGSVTGAYVIHTDNAAIARFTVSPAISSDATRCFYDYDTNVLDRRSFQFDTDGNSGTQRQCSINDLTPAVKVYIAPETSDSSKTLWSTHFTCPVTCVNCTSANDVWFLDNGSGNSGLSCDGVGEYPYFTTAAEDTDLTPDPPVTSAATTPPTVTGSTFTVASNCSDYATQKDAAEADANTANRVSKLVLPTTGCGPFNMEAIAGTGVVLVTGAADAKLLPPNGAMIDRTYASHVGWLGFSALGQWGSAGGEGSAGLITGDANARGYYFLGLEIGPPPLDSAVLAPLSMAITAIDTSTDTITVDDITGLTTGDSIEVVTVNLTGTGVLGGHGPFMACDVTSTTPPAGTFRLSYNLTTKTNCGTPTSPLVNLTGTYGAGGSVTRFVALPITAHTSEGSNHALTITGHGLANFPAMTVTGSPGPTQLTVTGTPADYQIKSGTSSEGTASGGWISSPVVLVEGTGTCDGLWRVSTIAGSDITLARTGQTPVCTGATTGTIRAQHSISVFQTSSDTIGDSEPRSFNPNVVDANTIELLETAAVGGVTGGYLFWELEPLGNLIQLRRNLNSNSVEDVTFDRVIIRACMPWWSIGAFDILGVENVAVVNSWIETCAWRRVNPVDSVRERVHGRSASHENVSPGTTKGLFVANNLFSPSPFVFDDDDNVGGVNDVSADDLTVSRNYFWNPSWTHNALGAFRNHHFERSFCIEHKSIGPRSLHSGNYLFQCASNFAPAQYALELSMQGSRAAPNGPTHADIEYNIFDGVASTIGATLTPGTTGGNRLFNLAEKFRIVGNLVVNIDSPTLSPGSNIGYFLVWDIPASDLLVDRNTYAPKRCQFCGVTMGRYKNSAGQFTNNALVMPEGSNDTRMGVRTEANNTEIPQAFTSSIQGGSLFTAFFQRGTATDVGQLSSWDTNVIIPGIRASTSGAYTTKAASALLVNTIAADDMYDFTRMAGLNAGLYAGNTTVGSATACSGGNCPDSLDQRLDLTFNAGVYSCISPTYDGKCADLATLADKQGFCGPVTLSGTTDTATTLNFHAATTAEVTVDRAAWNTDWATTWVTAASITRGTTANGATQTKTFSATGLTAATQYAYRIHGGGCGRALIGTVTTAGAP